MLAEYSARMETVLEWGMDDRKDVYFRSKAALETVEQTLAHEEPKSELLDELEGYVEEFEQKYLEEEDPEDDAVTALAWQEGSNNEPPAL